MATNKDSTAQSAKKQAHTSRLKQQLEILAETGISLLPAYGKHPGIAWSWFNHERMSLKRLLTFGAPGVLAINGRVSGNKLTLDYETHEGFADGMKDCWKWCGPTWATRTHDGGHINYRLPFAVKGEHIETTAGKLLFETRGQGQYVVAAPSPHPDGGFYEDITPPTFLRTVPDIPFLSLSPAPPSLILPRKARLLYYGHEKTINHYASNSEASMAFITSLLWAGFDDAFVESALSSSVWLNSYRRREMDDEKTAKDWLRLSLIEAHAWLSARTTDFQTFLAQWSKTISGLTWKGTTGNTDYKVTHALAHLAAAATRISFSPSVRKIAEVSTTNKATVSHSLKRLHQRGILHLRQPTQKGFPLTITLTTAGQVSIPVHYSDAQASSHNVISVRELTPDYLACWETIALGASARLVYESLCLAPQWDYLTIAAVTKKSLPTIKRAMPKLLKRELVLETTKGYEAETKIDWEALARELGGTARSEQRREQHRNDRSNRRKLKEIAQQKGDYYV